MTDDSGIQLNALYVDGGAAENNFLMQFQADILNVDVKRPLVTETTAMGAAYLAGLGVGYWNSQQDLMETKIIERCFRPAMADEERSSLLQGWKHAVASALSTNR
jgi:glycerol kinase